MADSARPTGMDLEHAFWVSAQPRSAADRNRLAQQADLAYLNALPGVVAAASLSSLPQSASSFFSVPVTTGPQQAGAAQDSPWVTLEFASARLPAALGLKWVAGRDFAAGSVQPGAKDSLGALQAWAPECIVTQALAARLFPHGDALGKSVYSPLGKPAVITGIVELLRVNPVPAQKDARATQVMILSALPAGADGTYVIRAAPGRRDEVMGRVEKEFAAARPDRFIARMEAYEVTAARARESDRATVLVLGAVAAVVLLVTVVGIAGLAAFNVSMRTRQLGVRRALGAQRVHIVRYFLLEAWITLAAGVALGCVGALAASVEFSRVYQVPRLPLEQLAGGALLIAMVGSAAVLIPSLRAAAVPPAVATRAV